MDIGSEIIKEIINKIGQPKSSKPTTSVLQKRTDLRKGTQSNALARLRKKTIENKRRQRSDLSVTSSRIKKNSLSSEKRSHRNRRIKESASSYNKGHSETTVPVLNKSASAAPQEGPNLRELSADLVQLGKRLRECYEQTAPQRQLEPLTIGESVVLDRRTRRRERKSRPKRRIRCQICNLFVNDRKSLDAHLRHRHHINSSGRAPHCSLCKLTFNGPIQERAHLIGKKHQSKVRKAELDRRSRARNK